jgi:uncharacterized membrane protein YfcA
MTLIPLINPLYVLSGFVVGTLVGLTGVGGGSLMTPLLVLVFGLHPSTAVGTDLLYAAATKSVGTMVHGFRNTIDWGIVTRLAAGSVPATALTLVLIAHLGKSIDTQHGLLNTVLGGALILSALSILLRRVIHGFFLRRGAHLDPTRRTVFTVALGAVLGALVSLSSVGAGAIGMTVLLVLYPTMPTKRLVGSDIAHAVPLTLLAGLGHWMVGTVNFGLLGSLLTGSIPGIIIGSLMASRASDRVLRPLLAGTLALVGTKMFF